MNNLQAEESYSRTTGKIATMNKRTALTVALLSLLLAAQAFAYCASCPRDARGRIKRSYHAKHAFEAQSGHPYGWDGHIVDHIVPLECGGADAPTNMQWQTIRDAREKDKWEGQCNLWHRPPGT